MACNPEVLRRVSLFALLDEEELAVLADQVELKTFAARQRIYKMGDPGGQAYVAVSGSVRVTTVDDDHQELQVDEPHAGEFFGFASMLDRTVHQTSATALEETVCIEVDRDDIAILLERKPQAGMDLLTVLGRQFHATQQLARVRSQRNPNEIIEEEATYGDHLADTVAKFGGSWSFIITFFLVLVGYTSANVMIGKVRLGSLSVHTSKPVSLDAGRHSSAGHHDEPEPAGSQGPPTRRTGLRGQPPRRVGDPGAVPQTQYAWGKDRRYP